MSGPSINTANIKLALSGVQSNISQSAVQGNGSCVLSQMTWETEVTEKKRNFTDERELFATSGEEITQWSDISLRNGQSIHYCNNIYDLFTSDSKAEFSTPI